MTSIHSCQYIGINEYKQLPEEFVSPAEWDIEVQIIDELNTEYEKARTLYNIEQSPENSMRLLEAGWKLRNYKPRNMVIV